MLEKAGELKRVREQVDPILEITEITDRVSKIGRAGAYFKKDIRMRPVVRRCCSKISRDIPVTAS